MPSSNLIRDQHQATHAKPFVLQEIGLGTLNRHSWPMISPNVIRGASAVPVYAFPTFETSSNPTHPHDTASAREDEAGQDVSSSPGATAPALAHEEGDTEVDPEAIPSPQDTGAEAFLQQAREEAERCLAEAHQKAQEIEVEACQTGFHQGEQAARQEIHQQFASILTSFQHATEDITNLRQEVLRLAEEDVITLAFQLARKIVHQEILSNRDVLAATLQRALTRVVDRGAVVVRVNPADLEQARELRQDLMHSIGTIRHLTIEGDETIGRGGCVVESAFGEIDARIEAQLEELEQRFQEQCQVVPEATVS